MSKFVVLVCATVIWCAARTTSETASVTYTYNSSDLSYLSNGIQFPVAESEVQPLLGADIRQNITEMQWFSGLYDHFKWWTHLNGLDSKRCRGDIMTYLRELSNATSWATKMYDASGRYTGQFFFGNDYWLGSKTLCKELTNIETNKEVPPFEVYFYVAKIRININNQATPVTRQLNLGECLPRSCGVAGVRMLLAQERNQGASVNIVGVREVPGKYSLLSDLKVHILGGTVLITVAIIVVASLTEIIIKKRHRLVEHKDAEVENNNQNQNNNNNNVDDNKYVKRSTEMVLKEENNKTNKTRNGIFLRLLLSFSAVSNGKKIISVDRVSMESIKCIHGLRFFSIGWIILVHSYLELFAIADNKNLRILTERGFMYQTISNATFSVDTFFFISGLLVTLLYFRTESKKQLPKKPKNTCEDIQANTLKFLFMLLYRVFRLTPAYLFVLGANEIVLRYIHNHSVFSPAIIDHVNCDKFWWRNALYINNFYPRDEFCMLWSWYMANDTQFYILASILLLIAVRGPKHVKFAAVSIGVLMLASWIVSFIIAMKWDYIARVEEPFALFDQLYDKPWLRIGPYLIGIMAGYMLFRIDCKISMSPIVVTAGWVASLACLASLVYGLGREGLAVPGSAFYAALGHTAWGLSLAWITIACCTGHGGVINAFLSCKLFLPLSRLTYCAYLVHPVLMCATSFVLDGSLHLHNAMAIVIFSGNVVLSFLCAFAISLAFEAPVVNLLKIVFA
ncbi:nose resistant to fluoxetine protein 6-like [Anoplophora glabripennis]|uniref:nose resistant to fluoxetine protein 6-like n=1 Tax=Anoplophora glabripennis TaxID=217634 RepID=UPI0008747A30|nr:nose resistant to fluoxetine protein 6-like [Anoplophora glabripennis]